MNALTESVTNGRTIRSIVQRHHQEVTDEWCRRLLRQLLQSLEIQHGMRLPQRAITPDTVVILDAGDPLLLPGEDDAPPAVRLADDMHALAGVVHYAISGEFPPAAPLAGRDLPGFSPSLLNALDQCLVSDPSLRPHTGAALRTLLAQNPPPAQPAPVVDTEPLPDPATAPAQAPTIAPAPEYAPEPVAGLRVQSAEPPTPAATLAHELPAAAPAVLARRPVWPWLAALLVLAVAGWFLLRYLDATGSQVPAPSAAVPVAATVAAPSETVSVGILIKPWGTVYVDGTEIGVSPPLKTLALVPGQHMIRIVNPDFREHQRLIDVAAGVPLSIEHEFTATESRP